MAANRSRQAQGSPRFFPHSPSYLRTTPWVRPAMLRDGMDYSRCRNEFGNLRGTPRERKGAALGWAALLLLLLFFPSFFPAALARQSFLHAPLFAGFQVKGVALHFFDDILLLHLALEAAQGILKGFSLLQPDFRQSNYTPQLVPFWTRIVIARFIAQSQELSAKLSLLSEIVAPHDRTPLPTDLRGSVSLI